MERQISFSQYRAIDLGIMAGLLTISQFLITMSVTVWFPQELYVVSPVAVIVALVMMRWSGWAGIHACLGGVVLAVASGGRLDQILIYGLGNLLSLGALVMLKLLGKERVRKSSFLSLMFALCCQLLMLLGRGAVAALLQYPLEVCWGFVTTDLLSVLFTLVIIWITRKVDGLFEDQKHYLLRMECERQK